MRYPIVLVAVSVMLPGMDAIADSATQTDWSGGYGILGPVTDWGNEFYMHTNASWSSDPGEVSLGGIVEHTVDGDFDAARSVYARDVDGDGHMDVLGAGDDYITWWENDDGSGTSWTEHTVDASFYGARSVYAQDVNGDGYMDVLGASRWLDVITWWENDDGSGTSWTWHLVGNCSWANSVYAQDVDGDGDMDVLGAAFGSDDITWWENDDGSGTSWTEHTVDGNVDGAHSVYAQDVDGDGDMDVLGAAFNGFYGDDITWWENDDGSGTSWTKHTVEGDYDGARSVYAQDVDGDGDMDVLGAFCSVDLSITWWENDDGSGTSWTEHTVDAGFSDPGSVYAQDFDGDGDMDVLGASTWYDGIAGWENDDGSGTSWTGHTINANFNGAYSVYAQDVDGDGDMDALGASSLSDDITWWDLASFASEGSLESSCLYLGNDPGWGSIGWTCSEPAGTSVVFQVRACDSPDSTEMGVWSDTLYSPCSLAGILDEYDSYFQYRAILQRSDSTVTPVLEDVTITWDPVGIEGGEGCELQLLPVSPNPSSGFPVLRFSLPESESVELSVFDLSGRMVQQVEENEYSAGYHEIQMESLSSGIYFCRMRAGAFEGTRRFAVIE